MLLGRKQLPRITTSLDEVETLTEVSTGREHVGEESACLKTGLYSSIQLVPHVDLLVAVVEISHILCYDLLLILHHRA